MACPMCKDTGVIIADGESRNPHFQRFQRMPCPMCKGEVAGLVRPHAPGGKSTGIMREMGGGRGVLGRTIKGRIEGMDDE